ncbi:30S ribosomal protein S11 [Candidatus Dependentiae bacterium]
MAYKKKSKKVKRQVDSVMVHVRSTFNNTLVTVTTMEGDVLFRGSSGKLGFKGSRKGTPFAASQIASGLAKDMNAIGVKNVEVNLQGPGSGRDSVVRALQASGLNISVLRDVTPLPHNGCRPPKKRRV